MSSPAGEPAVAAPAPDGGLQPYIVQFHGPIAPEWAAQIRAAGGTIVDYVPDFAYVALLEAQSLERVRTLPAVRWAGYLQPAYRVDPQLQDIQGAITVTISRFPGSSAAATAALLQQTGSLLSASGSGQVLSGVVTAQSLAALAAQPDVAWIEPLRQARLWNDVARAVMGVNPIWNSHGLTGRGEIIAIADSGLDSGDTSTLAADFRGRVVAAHAWGREGDWSDGEGHGTHVAGSAVGNGLNSGSDPAVGNYAGSHAGVAPEAGLVVQAIMNEAGHMGESPLDLGAILQQAYDDGARVHSNSWGVPVADGGRTYDAQAQQVDRFAWEHQDMVVLFAAGNDGEDADRDGIVDLGSVTTPATAKNVLTVGASESVRFSGGYTTGGLCSTWGECWGGEFPVAPLHDDPLSNNPAGMAAFSSRGPAPDGRLKPDLVAPGTNILSTRSSLASEEAYWGTYGEYYAYDGGTSMSTPLVAGAAALVRQFYRQDKEHEPSASLVKATLLAGAVDLAPGQFGSQTEIPPAANSVEGWGRLDLTNALFPVAPRRVLYVDALPGLATGEATVYTYTVASASTPLRIILAWTDYPGSLLAYPNNVNDLDLSVSTPVTSTDTGSERGPDRLNNVEGVVVASPAPGVYRVVVTGYNVPIGPQPYALVISGDLIEGPVEPAVSLGYVPGFVTAGSTLTVTWAISHGNVVTETALLWDRQSHAADLAYSNAISAQAMAAWDYTAALTVPETGAVYLTAAAWIDGRRYYAPSEAVINVVAEARRVFLPIVLTYPAPEPTPTPVVTTTPLAVTQLVRNEGFEDGAPQSPPWHQYDRADPAALLVSDFWPHSGRWSARLGGANDDYQQLYQTIAVPAGTTHASLSFYWHMNSEDSIYEPHDVLNVRLLNAAGEPLVGVLRRDNTGVRDHWVMTLYSWVGDFPYAGQTLRLSFDMATDSSGNTYLYVDDVRFFVSSSPIPGAQAGAVESR